MRLILIFLATFVFTSIIIAQNNINFEELEKQELKEFNTPNEKDYNYTHLSPNQINGTIWVNDSIVVFYPIEDGWIPAYVYEVPSRNLKGQKTSRIIIKRNFDNLEWENVLFDTITYYNNGIRKSYLRLDWNDTDKKYSDSSYLKTYNENGDRLLKIYYQKYKYQYTYNNKDEIKEEEWKWNDTDKIWENYRIITTEYGENKEWKKRIYKYWNKDKKLFEDKYKYFYTYENNKIIKNEVFTGDVESEQWIPRDLEKYSYNEEGNIELRISQKWNSEEKKWVNRYKYVNSYNSNKLLETSLKLYWADSTWANVYKNKYKYKDGFYVSEYSDYEWNSDLFEWIPMSKRITKYDSFYNRIETIDSLQDSSGELSINMKIIYTWSQYEVSGTSESQFNSINVYPNPTKDFFVVAGLNNIEILSIRIHNLSGTLVKSIKGLNNNFVDIKSLDKGLYFVKIATKEGVITKKIIKQ